MVAGVPVFVSLGPEGLDEAVRTARRREFARGEIIAGHGEDWPYALLVVKGSARLVKGSEAGRVLAALTVGPGELLLGPSLFDAGPMPASLEAETSCLVYLWDGEGFARLVKTSPAALWQVSVALVRQMRKASDVIDTLAFRPLSARLARLLLEHFGPDGTGPAPRSLTLDDMAARVGTTREVVCRMLYRLASEGLINITRTEFALLDRSRLAELAGQDRPPA